MKALVRIDAAMKALQKATTVAEVKNLHDIAETMRAHAKKVGAELELQNRCAELKIRSERKGGQLLIRMAKQKERHPGRGDHAELHDAIPLADLGIEKTQSHRWQLLARMVEAEFETELAACIDAGNELTSALELAESQNEAENCKRQSLVDQRRSKPTIRRAGARTDPSIRCAIQKSSSW